jgi:hypothetical protein
MKNEIYSHIEYIYPKYYPYSFTTDKKRQISEFTNLLKRLNDKTKLLIDTKTDEILTVKYTKILHSLLYAIESYNIDLDTVIFNSKRHSIINKIFKYKSHKLFKQEVDRMFCLISELVYRGGLLEYMNHHDTKSKYYKLNSTFFYNINITGTFNTIWVDYLYDNIDNLANVYMIYNWIAVNRNSNKRILSNIESRADKVIYIAYLKEYIPLILNDPIYKESILELKMLVERDRVIKYNYLQLLKHYEHYEITDINLYDFSRYNHYIDYELEAKLNRLVIDTKFRELVR